MCVITIVIPTYNSSLTLSDTINSVLTQTFNKFEILIMDGDSKDNTIVLAKEYNDNRIKIYSEKDKGIYDAMNKGIKLAKGDWLYFLGSDDVLYNNNVLSDIYKFINNRSEIDLVYGDALYKHSRNRHYGVTSLKRLLLETNMCHQSVFYNRTVFDRIGNYNLKYFLYADWDLNIRCFMHPDFCIKYINIIVALYNDTEGTSAKFIDTDLDFLNIVPKYHIESQRQYFLNTREFKLGSTLLKPFYFIYNLLKIKSLKN